VTPEPVVRTVAPSTLDAAALAEQKRGLTVSVCLPARNEAATVGGIVEAIAASCEALVDEVLVLDDGSTDDTAAVAASAGATVVAVDDVLPELPRGSGKGNVLWKSLAVAKGDLLVWCDADLETFTSAYVTRLVAPLLADERVQFVKADYDRPAGDGRTTQLVARPLLARFFPPLATVRQPLSGECAARTELLEQLPFVESYGVEVGLLIDVLATAGLDAMAQVDLGAKEHRHRPLAELSVQAGEIIDTILERAGVAQHHALRQRPPMRSITR
jgi:glucosyl-3-phosphoglycerate synthase